MQGMMLYVQPAYNNETDNIEYAEVLIREYRGFDTVHDIFRYIEDNNMHVEFDLEVFEVVIKTLSHKEDKGYPMAVNLCARTADKKGIADKLLSIIRENEVNPERIVLELHESTDFTDEIVKENVQKLRDNKVKIAIDDFGVKSANLQTLITMSIDILKVDKSFVEDNREYCNTQSEILKLLFNLCKAMKIQHVVEGVETERQLSNIKATGYSLIQGYYYYKPVPYAKRLNNGEIVIC